MDPILRKRMIVCTPFGKFVNGEQHGVMDVKRLRGLVQNFTKHPRPVPVYAMGDHVGALDERLPDGWVEGLTLDAEGRLIADVKMHGDGARLVLDDLVRLASIGTIQGKNPDGSAQGEILQHVLLTNDAFDKQANIQVAAALAKGAELYAYFTTALPAKEMSMTPMEHCQAAMDLCMAAINSGSALSGAGLTTCHGHMMACMDAMKAGETTGMRGGRMADPKVDEELTRLREENAALKAATPDEKAAASLKESQTLLAEKIREVAELTASNENLKADVEKFKSPKAIEEMNKTVAMQARQLRAEKIRRLVKSGVESGQFNRGLVGDPKTGYDHPSDEMVLSWFTGSAAFKGNFERLETMLDTMPKQRIGRTFPTGEGHESIEAAFTEDDKTGIIAAGAKPEHVVAALKAKTFKEYQAATAAAK